MAVVYQHRRLDTNEIFYIGIGNKKTRAFIGTSVSKTKRKTKWRNPHWNNIAIKTDIVVEIVYEDISYQFALEKEKELILKYGRIDLGTGTLTNLTDGGEGTVGFSDEIMKKISRKGFKHSEETKQKLAISSSILNKGRKLSDDVKKKISESAKGNQRRLGAVLSEETKDKISKSNMGKIAHNKGKSSSIETRQKLSTTLKANGTQKGENNARAILNQKIADDIRYSYNVLKQTQRSLAKQYGVSASTISAICCNIIWI
jgi:hypothetical protein